jgi:hypothetical protein
MVIRNYNPATQEAMDRRIMVQDQPWANMKPYWKNN